MKKSEIISAYNGLLPTLYEVADHYEATTGKKYQGMNMRNYHSLGERALVWGKESLERHLYEVQRYIAEIPKDEDIFIANKDFKGQDQGKLFIAGLETKQHALIEKIKGVTKTFYESFNAILNSVAMSDEPVLNIIQTIASLKKEIHEHEADPDLKKLSVGQLAALCSNLARGCEKQYKEEEAALFRELAAYFTANTPAVADATVDDLAKAMQADIDHYAEVRKAADAARDRGAARICVWGEKVTLMLSSLVSRYLQNGESLLADTEIWVCTACGFVFIGDTPPQQCPVCKVPDWKFEKIERRAAK